MSTFTFSKTDAAKRRDLYFKAATEAARTWYDAEGNFIAPSFPPATRERYWLALALYAQGANALADAVVRKGKVGYLENGQIVNFDIFHTNIAAVLLHHYRDKMAPDVQALLESRVRDAFPFEPGDRRCDFQFHGYNDNMPSEASIGLIIGGELLDDKASVEHGVWNLRQMASMLHRRGINSEWNSPTYSPVTLHCMAEIAECAHHPEARELALKIEQRLWLDFAGRFHPEIGVIAPPYCRAYYADALAHLSLAASMFWFVFGDIARPSPMELFNPKSGLVLHHENDVPFNVAQMCIFGSDGYHPPQAAIDLFHRKAYPFRAVATAEHGDGTPDYAASPARLETVLMPDFAVGTSNIPWIGGEQSETYGVIYKRKKEPRSFQDVGVVYHKFLINDDEPGKIIFPKDGESKTYSNSGEQYYGTRCGMATVQGGTSVIVATHPQLNLAGIEDMRPPTPLTRLSEMVTFPSHFGGADEVRIGDRALASWSGEAKYGEWIGARRGRLLIAVRPLAYNADLPPVKITLEKINNYEVVRANFYQGPERTFSRSELRRMLGGFVAEHASVDDYPSLADFLADLSAAKFTHQYLTTRRVRYRRPEGKKLKAVELELSWTHGGVATRFTAVNGKVPSVEPPVQIDGLKESDFPLLSEWKSVPAYFPWPVLRAPCNKVDGIIVDREE